MRKNVSYIIGFTLLLVFCTWVYGPVFRHLADESYFSFEAETMKFVLRQDYGQLYWGARFLLLPLGNQWLGGLYLALLLTLIAFLVDKVFRLPESWRGLGFIVPSLLMGWVVNRGYNLYMRQEPSLVILYLYVILTACIIAYLLRIVFLKKIPEESKEKLYKGLCISVLSLVILTGYAWYASQNVIFSCSMQNKLMDSDFHGMIEDGLKVRTPDRSVAAFYAIALNQNNELLERAFEIDYDYPVVSLDPIGGLNESENYTAECDFYSGLILPAYHYALCQQVVEGPRVRFLKLLIMTSALQGETDLCHRYLSFLRKMPFQQEFVETWKNYLRNPELMLQSPVLKRVLDQDVYEQCFEEDFQSPLFIGYRLAMNVATQESMPLAIGAGLYLKDLKNVAYRANYLAQQGSLPTYVQQALVMTYATDADRLNKLGVSDLTRMNVGEFAREMSDYIEKKTPLADIPVDLRKKWKGSYMYYYYFGNRKVNESGVEATGVN